MTLKCWVICHAPRGACELKSQYDAKELTADAVTPREGRVSWNVVYVHNLSYEFVTPREGRVSWNFCNQCKGRLWECHAPWGACELKLHQVYDSGWGQGHAPRGACELKWQDWGFGEENQWSRPARGVWVEICFLVEILVENRKSRPARGVWVEIPNPLKIYGRNAVTPREGRVSWNCDSQRERQSHACHASQGRVCYKVDGIAECAPLISYAHESMWLEIIPVCIMMSGAGYASWDNSVILLEDFLNQ